MKKFIAAQIVFALTTLSSQTFADKLFDQGGVNFCTSFLEQPNVFYSTGATTLCGAGSTNGTVDMTSNFSSSLARKNLMMQAIHGAQGIKSADSEAQMKAIYDNDGNVQDAFTQLANEGFVGTYLDFAEKVLDEVK